LKLGNLVRAEKLKGEVKAGPGCITGKNGGKKRNGGKSRKGGSLGKGGGELLKKNCP